MNSQKIKKAKREAVISFENNVDQFAELKFIADLGKTLLNVKHPQDVTKCVAESLEEAVRDSFCAVFVNLENYGLLQFGVDLTFANKSNLLKQDQIYRWLEFFPSDVSVRQSDTAEFFISGSHNVEYVSPLLVNGEVKGAVVAAFNEKYACDDRKQRLIDASTQMAAMSIGLSANFQAVNLARQEQQKFNDAILDALPVSLYVIDRDFHIVAWNRHREIGTLGLPREEVLGRNIFDILTKQPRQKLQPEFERAFSTGKIERIEQRTADEHGIIKHWLVSKVPMRDKQTGEITHVITVGEDITIRVDAMNAVARAEKLSAVGRLAAGVVHEINNPLATIAACAEALELRVGEGLYDDSPDVVDLREYLGLIRSEAFRCKTITNGLLDFSRVRSGVRASIDIADVLKSSARLLSHQKRGDNIEINVDVNNRELLLVNADEGQIQQAVIALATNAIDAMPDGGTLNFRGYKQNNRVIIEVKDTGIGISPENLPKIFEPFFTTKAFGKGTGLGLAVCYGIITEHGGRLSVRSTIGKGTAFTMFLPIPNEENPKKAGAIYGKTFSS
jgi:two-component system, NtrC family, sensor kinase